MMSETRKKDSETNPEVVEKATRRRFTSEYKSRILAEADRCTVSGELGELLRREGLYSSHLRTWRRQRESGSDASLSGNRRGRKPKLDRNAPELARLNRENKRLNERLRQAETIIDVQKKVCEMLGILPATPDESDA
jgi:transposase